MAIVVVKVTVKCIHCRSDAVVKMGKQVMELHAVNATHVEKHSKRNTQTMALHLKLNY